MSAKAVLTIIAVTVALATAIRGPTFMELPPVRNPNCLREVWPERDLETMDIGGYEWQAYDHFGRHNNRVPLLDSLEPQRCVAFVYDEEVLWNAPLALTILVESRKIRGKWLAPDAFSQRECTDLPREVVALKGFFQAGSCW